MPNETILFKILTMNPMKIILSGILINFVLPFSSCGPDPDLKQKGFESQIAYQVFLKKEAWLRSDDKFLNVWGFINKEYSAWGVEQEFILKILEGGHGIFFESQKPGTFRKEANFNWKTVNDTTIEISNLYGPQDEFDGSYRFKRFNGNYSISYNSKCRKLGEEYRFCQ